MSIELNSKKLGAIAIALVIIIALGFLWMQGSDVKKSFAEQSGQKIILLSVTGYYLQQNPEKQAEFSQKYPTTQSIVDDKENFMNQYYPFGANPAVCKQAITTTEKIEKEILSQNEITLGFTKLTNPESLIKDYAKAIGDCLDALEAAAK